MTKGVFIVGTGTDVGKTIVSAGIVSLLRDNNFNACYFKAALSGAIKENEKLIPGDTRFVTEVSGINEKYEDITPYIFKNPVSPHLASKLENKSIDLNHIQNKFNYIKSKYDYVIVEGSGGILCPLIDNKNHTYMLCDLIKNLKINIILVASSSLGTINYTLLTIKYIQDLGINIEGIIFNGFKDNIMHKDNIEFIKRKTNIPILGIIDYMENLDVEKLIYKDLKTEFYKKVNINNLLNCMNEI